jgi:hypothetical protein
MFAGVNFTGCTDRVFKRLAGRQRLCDRRSRVLIGSQCPHIAPSKLRMAKGRPVRYPWME